MTTGLHPDDGIQHLLKTVTIGETEYQAGPRSVAIIQQLLNGCSGGVRFSSLIEDARTVTLTIHCGERKEDVSVKVGV